MLAKYFRISIPLRGLGQGHRYPDILLAQNRSGRIVATGTASSVSTIVIQPYRSGHRQGVIDVILPIQQQEFGIPVTLADQPDPQDVPGFYQQKAGNFWVALAGAEVVGTIALVDIGHRQAALRKMFVKEAWRGKGKGVAQALLETLLRWDRQQDLREIYLGTTAKFLAAHRFYEKNGFRVIAKAMLPPAFPVMNVDTKFYRFEL